MTHFLEDILRQPEELRRTLAYLAGAGRGVLQTAATAIRNARHVYLTGIGSSWHAALSVAPLFYQAARPIYMVEASELLPFATLPPDAVVIAISRSGRSVEIVHLLAKARESRATVIGITNAPDGPLAREAQIAIVLPIKLDHAISVNTYSTLAASAGALAGTTVGSFDDHLAGALTTSVTQAELKMTEWRQRIADSTWFTPGKSTYFLARGGALGSCHEARLLWEEGVKSPATALGAGGFRHGPQEMVTQDVRFGLWIHALRMREQDLSVARDLRRLGASVLLIGQQLAEDAGDIVLQIPAVPADWQFLIDIIPAQLAAEHLARLRGVDCDSFRFCSYIVEDEFGLVNEGGAGPAKENK